MLLAKHNALDNAGLYQVYAYNPFASISLHPVWVSVQWLLEGAFGEKGLLLNPGFVGQCFKGKQPYS